MAIKNTRSTLKESALDNKLKAKLKEGFKKKKVLKEEEADFNFDDDNEDVDVDVNAEGGDEFADDDFGGDEFGGEGVDDGEFADDFEAAGLDALNPDQQELVDDEVDELLQPAEDILADEEGDGMPGDYSQDDLALDEADDFDFGDDDSDVDVDIEGSGDEDFNLDIEEGGDELGDVAEDGVEDIDSTFSAEELQNIIDNPNTLGTLEGDLVNRAQDGSLEGGEGLGGEEDTWEDDSEGLDEATLMAEAELENEIEEAYQATPQGGDPMSGLTDEDQGGFDQGYEGKERKDELMEADDLGFTDEDAEIEGKFATVKKTEGKEGAIEGKGGLKDMAQEVKKESIQKSKMLVKLAEKVNALQKFASKLKLENYRLIKANGILAAAGDKLDTKTRVKISESFDACKSTEQVNKLYSKITSVIKERAKGSLNEAAMSRKSGVKSFNLLKEGREEGEMEISKEQRRANLMMGIKGSDDAYYSNF
jgi:hypothetical protein